MAKQKLAIKVLKMAIAIIDAYFDGCLEDPSVVTNVKSTSEERNELGKALLDVSLDWKRILSPMLTYEIAQEVLVLVHRNTSDE